MRLRDVGAETAVTDGSEMGPVREGAETKKRGLQSMPASLGKPSD